MSNQLDDWSQGENLNRSVITSRRRQYKDLDLSLELNPNTNDISVLKDDRAVKNAVKNLILTNFFERPFQSLKGGNISSFLFEPAGNITTGKIKNAITRVLTEWEPRIEIINIKIIDNTDENNYDVTIAFLIKEINLATTVDIILQRVR